MTERLLFNPSNYYFNYNAIIPAFTALILLTISAYVLLKEKKDTVSISFISYLLSKTIWLSGMAVIYSTQSYLVAETIFKYYVFFGVAIVSPTFYLFTSSLLNLQKRWLFVLINYIIAITFFIINLRTNYLFVGIKEYSYGYYPILNTPVSYIFLLYYFGNVFMSFKNLITKFNRIWTEERERIKDIVIGFIIFNICCIDYLPAYGIEIYPYSFIFLIIGLTYVFNTRPWSGVKEEALLEQKEEEEYIFIFEDNIDKLTAEQYSGT